MCFSQEQIHSLVKFVDVILLGYPCNMLQYILGCLYKRKESFSSAILCHGPHGVRGVCRTPQIEDR